MSSFLPKLKKIKIGFDTYIKELKHDIVYACCPGRRSRIEWTKEERVFKLSSDILDKDLNVMGLIETIHKLQAGMEVLFARDQKNLKKIQYMYY
jgi:hypothetical protein